LTTGASVTVDAGYVSESILNPSAKIVAGYENIMPTFSGLVTAEGVTELVEYVKSIGPAPGAPGSAPAPAAKGAPAAKAAPAATVKP
jgi:cytochrome c oxidase subunit 2